MHRNWLLVALPLLLGACSTRAQVLRGQFMWEFERREFIECGTGKLYTVRDTGFMAKHKDAHALRSGDVVELKGHVTQPGSLGSVGVTSGTITVDSVRTVPPDDIRCPHAAR